MKRVTTKLRGQELLHNSLMNKGTAFTQEERLALNLEGVLPSHWESMDTQADRLFNRLQRVSEPLEKYVALSSLQDRNEHLFFRVVKDHLQEYLPIIYTPTVGLATKRFSHEFRRGRGLWITPDMRGRIVDILDKATQDRRIRLLLVTDNESILGIGDQGAGGMAIAIGKLSIYTVGAGIHPACVLPVSLDVGTNNPALLNDPWYLGWKNKRLCGEKYNSLIEEFVRAVKQVFPGAMVQWEDFRKENALNVLDRYKTEIPSFNDDIQGTGAVALSGIYSAEKISGRSLVDERIVIFGAGAAGLGITRQIRAALRDEGCNNSDINERIAVLDSKGLIVADGHLKEEYKLELAMPEGLIAKLNPANKNRDLETVIDTFKPTVLIGCSGQPGAFTKNIIEKMIQHVDRPVIFPFSNPTDKCEAIPDDLYAWTNGQCLIATGSPFADIKFAGRVYGLGQGNNAFIFPAIGLATLVAGIRQITDELFTTAAKVLSDCVTSKELECGLLFPNISRLPEISLEIAEAVIGSGIELGLCNNQNNIREQLRQEMWEPEYPAYSPE